MKGEEKAEDIICPVCGYYCLGNGGYGCIDKLTLWQLEKGLTSKSRSDE